MLFKNQLTTELIKYQVNDKYIEDAVEIIEKIYISIQTGVYKSNKDLLKNSKDIKDLIKLHKTRFNLNVIIPHELSGIEGYYAAVIPILGDNLSAIKKYDLFGVSQTEREMEKKITEILKYNNQQIAKNNKKKGYVDFKNAKVGGYLADYLHTFIFDFFVLKDEFSLTPVEVVAVILHETGHIFHGLSEHFKLERVNSIYNDILDEINNNKPDRAIYIYNTRVASSAEFQQKAVSESMERQDFEKVMLSSYVDIATSQVIDSKYLDPNFEAIADNFTAKFGLGLEISSALRKLYGHENISVDQAAAITRLSTLFNAMTYTILMLSIIGIPLVAVVFLFGAGKDNEWLTYDTIKDRYERLYLTTVGQLKKLHTLNNETVESIVYSATMIKHIIDATPEVNDVMAWLANNIRPAAKQANYYYKIQRQLERGLNNDLYLDSARLKTL